MRGLAVALLSFGALSAFAAACGGGSNDQNAGAPEGGVTNDASSVPDAGALDAAPDAWSPLCPNGVAAPYPSDTAIAVSSAIPDLTFASVDTNGAPTTIALHDSFEPCAAQSRLLVIRVSAGWCGTCRWEVGHTSDLKKLDIGSRITLVDLLIADDDNMPPVVADLAAWRARIDAPEKVAIDPAYTLNALNAARKPLPLIVVVDTRTMTIVDVQSDPDPDVLALFLRIDLAALDGASKPVGTAPQKFDDRFNRKQWDMIKAMGGVPTAPPPDPTNAVADKPEAAALGKSLFADTSLSPSDSVSCAKCHDSGQLFTDSLPQSVGVTKGDRNAPSLMFAAHSPRWQFWDGRADSLWAQAVGPFENEKEFASSRLFVAHAIFDRYKSAYEAIFGPMPLLADAARFPASGKPGDASWTAMAPADQTAVTRVYVNVGKSIAAFERTIRAQPNALDAYAAGDLTALTKPQKDALFSYFSAGCAQCHYGPRLTDDAFHAVRFPTGRQDAAADRGRIDGIPIVLASELTSSGAFSDSATSPIALTASPSMLGAFKTPTLRGIPSTAPYGHGGTLATLDDVVKNYGTSGLPDSDPRATGTSEPWLPLFDAPTQAAIPTFLQVLTAQPVP